MGSAPSRPPVGPPRRLWRRIAYVALLVLVLSVGVGARVLAGLPLPEPDGQDLTTVVLDRRGEVIGQLHAEQNRIALSLEEIAPVLIDAVIASEDRDFFSHAGVDPVAIGRAAWADIRSEGELQGGSTITQQYVKNAYLDADRTLVRKLREAFLAIRLERELTKGEILERYLNTIYFGRGAYGVEAASQVWFGTSAADVDVAQAAYLAALIRAPEAADIEREEQVEVAYRRRSSVLDAMLAEGYITADEHRAGDAIPIENTTLPRRDNQSVNVAVDGDLDLEYVLDMVRRELIERYGARATFAGGLEVTTTIDLDVQRAAIAARDRTVTDPSGPDVAIVVLDDQGHVRALVGGTDFEESEVNLATGRDGGGGGRQPGSAMKPLVLAHALESGVSPATTYPSPPSLLIASGDGGPDWEVGNPGGVDLGEISLTEATVLSSNTAFAGLAADLDLDDVIATVSSLGVDAPLDPFPSLVLGAQEVSVLDMAVAYSTFAAGGLRRDPLVISEVRSADGGVMDRLTAPGDDVLSRDTARAVTEVLTQVIDRGTGREAAVPGARYAGKTGTSQENRDAWFVGYSPIRTVAVWMGYGDDGRPMRGVLGVDAVTGGSYPASLWREVMVEIHDGTAPGTFPWE